ncbi:hypothetical protein T265_07861 [Opisthorchis viverrini]|uniref:Uncharacterized protein n=1 Tax=Opisthorchis viverrini TaxID=6198 RepID=A0A074ZB18_OPIVI|nr:hypothetical protein T265_07861 [Opisthorchis viverrini]KER24496.1 hypothetical protein T265_07861 [Opisthorchis viverrini]
MEQESSKRLFGSNGGKVGGTGHCIGHCIANISQLGLVTMAGSDVSFEWAVPECVRTRFTTRRDVTQPRNGRLTTVHRPALDGVLRYVGNHFNAFYSRMDFRHVVPEFCPELGAPNYKNQALSPPDVDKMRTMHCLEKETKIRQHQPTRAMVLRQRLSDTRRRLSSAARNDQVTKPYNKTTISRPFCLTNATQKISRRCGSFNGFDEDSTEGEKVGAVMGGSGRQRTSSSSKTDRSNVTQEKVDVNSTAGTLSYGIFWLSQVGCLHQDWKSLEKSGWDI